MYSKGKADDDDDINYYGDSLDPKLVELLKRYKYNKLEVLAKTPLNVIQRRITKMLENQYIRTRKRTKLCRAWI